MKLKHELVPIHCACCNQLVAWQPDYKPTYLLCQSCAVAYEMCIEITMPLSYAKEIGARHRECRQADAEYLENNTTDPNLVDVLNYYNRTGILLKETS